MKRRIKRVRPVILVLLMLLLCSSSGFSAPPDPGRIKNLEQHTIGGLDITWDQQSGNPSFIRGRIPLWPADLKEMADPGTLALAFVGRYREVFGLKDPEAELEVVESVTDELGMAHVTLRQVYQRVEVYNAQVRVHLSADGKEVVAVSNGFVPGIALPNAKPQVSADQALTTARMALPKGELTSGPKLAVYPGATGKRSGASARLAWLVELWDDWPPADNVYVVDATAGTILDVLDRLYEGRNRRTYTANHGTRLPGTLARSEGQGPTGDRDVDNAHDFAGTTYDYYHNTHGRDSYDDRGATMVSTVHYGRNYSNAFWTADRKQTVYGDGFAVKDVIAHEWTHAVTEHSANLEYRWQSGALNESFSDIFGAMVDRDDWLIGEDLPPDALGGREAIRDMSNPSRFGQPDHTDDWVSTCSDHEGVHTNNGIPNKAYYNIATAIGKNKAERIFYRTLVIHLQPTSSMEDARAAALQSAQDLYARGSAEYNAVRDGFNAVGLDGVWQPPANDCGPCSATGILLDKKAYPDRLSSLQAVATLYRTRDQLLEETPTGQHYRALYYRHTGRISYLLLRDAELRAMGRRILQEVTPGLNRLLDGKGEQALITHEVVAEVITFLKRLAEADKGGALAQTIEQEMKRVDLQGLTGMTFEEAWKRINNP